MAVAHQQLNGTAANTILARFKKLFPGRKFPAPGRSGRGDGRANPRLRIFLRQNQIHPRHHGKDARWHVPSSRQIVKLSDDEIVARLTEVRGVGRWTVEMLLIFQLGPARRFAGGRFRRAHRFSPRLQKARDAQAEGTAGLRRTLEAAPHHRRLVSLVRGGRGQGRGEKEVTPRRDSGYKFPFGRNSQKLWFMKHLLSLEKLPGADIEKILRDAVVCKRERARRDQMPLAGQIWALMFSKSSTRTRVSFEVGIRELGGQTMFLSASEIQLGRGEPIKDTARVLGRMIHGAVIRTFAQSDVEEFAEFSGIPTINALTDDEHPCQILADIFTFQEKRGPIARQGGDVHRRRRVQRGALVDVCRGESSALNCASPRRRNSSRAPRTCCNARGRKDLRAPTDFEPAAKGADLLYTDVWVSMGKEAESAERLKMLTGYQINPNLVKLAKPDALVMHCLPAYRGKEIDDGNVRGQCRDDFHAGRKPAARAEGDFELGGVRNGFEIVGLVADPRSLQPPIFQSVLHKPCCILPQIFHRHFQILRPRRGDGHGFAGDGMRQVSILPRAARRAKSAGAPRVRA